MQSKPIVLLLLTRFVRAVGIATDSPNQDNESYSEQRHYFIEIASCNHS